MSTLILDVPDSVAERWDSLTEEERQRQVAAMVEAITALDTAETPPVTAPPVGAFADEILEILGPEFAFDPKKQGTRTTARLEGFPSFDTEKPVTEAHLSPLGEGETLSQGRTLADAMLEALGPEFAPDFTRTGTSDTARHEDFSDMDINGKFRR